MAHFLPPFTQGLHRGRRVSSRLSDGWKRKNRSGTAVRKQIPASLPSLFRPQASPMLRSHVFLLEEEEGPIQIKRFGKLEVTLDPAYCARILGSPSQFLQRSLLGLKHFLSRIVVLGAHIPPCCVLATGLPGGAGAKTLTTLPEGGSPDHTQPGSHRARGAGALGVCQLGKGTLGGPRSSCGSKWPWPHCEQRQQKASFVHSSDQPWPPLG